MARRSRTLKGAPEYHAERVAEIHGQIEQGLREAARTAEQPRLAQTRNGCRIFFDVIRSLEDRVGRAQGHLDGVAGSTAATTAMFKTQKRLASRVGSMGTKFKRRCMKGV